MNRGLFDLPEPLLQWIGERLNAVVPAPVSIALWAIVAGILCLELYRIASPQERIRRIRHEAKAAQRRLAAYDGELEQAWPMIRSMLGLSLKRVGIVIPATLLAAYPAVALLAWMSNSYSYVFPDSWESVAVEIAAPLQAQLLNDDSPASPLIQARRPDGEVVLELPLAARVPVVHKRAWWNLLIENPAGYLPDDMPFDEIRIGLPRLELYAVGPSWIRGWEAVFLSVMFVAALTYKTARRID